MEFIQIAYCVTVPVLLLLSWLGSRKYFFMNVLAVSNLLLIGYSYFLIRQLIGLYQLSKQFHIPHQKTDVLLDLSMLRLFLVVILPILSLVPRINKSHLFSIVLLTLLYWNTPLFSWNSYDLFTKIPMYVCLLCSGYALLWLLNKLPYQSPVA
jgi:hypothetical protein